MKHFLTFIALLFAATMIAQTNTVGLLSYDPMKAYDGYNLFFPHNQPNVYLINNCGEIVHTWEDSAQYRPGNIAYLLENGDLVKGKRHFNISDDRIWAGGGGAIIEIRDWDNNLKWSFELNDSLHRLHHDFAVTNDGTILMIAWELKTLQECLDAGRDTSLLDRNEMWPDYIIEVDPETDEIIWEWYVWDHLIQDHDPSRENFGVIANNPGLVDINYPITRTHPDWMHANSIDYNPFLDLIALSIPYFDEVWFIDHSTSTAEAASHSGGLSDLGGDLMFRWGNPLAYQAGDTSDQRLFFQHDAHWIDDYLPIDHPDFGKLAVFNNRIGSDFSVANIVEPVFDMYTYSYQMNNGKWLPEVASDTIAHPIPQMLYSTGLSSVQILPNGNRLLCSGRFGYSFELTPSNEIVWEYKTPLMGGNPVDQGTVLGINNNLTFRMKRIPADNAAFEGRDLSAKGYIETNPNVDFCDSLVSTMDHDYAYDLKLYPNPASDQLTIEWNGPERVEIAVYSALGQPVAKYETYGGRMFLNTTNWTAGFHFIMINGSVTKVVLIE